MSKMDALRAMREARYAKATARAPQPTAAPKATPPPVAPPVHPPVETRRPATDPPPTDEVCGHRAISGRTCTREQGHAAKSHRYQ